MTTHVERKQVYRWYVVEGSKRKPYGTRFTAYRSVARRLLRIEVFGGEDYPRLDDRQDEINKARNGYKIERWGDDNVTADQHESAKLQAWDELMAVKFPHSVTDHCAGRYCRFVINEEYGYPTDERGNHILRYKSCKVKIDAWIDAKIKELQAEDE